MLPNTENEKYEKKYFYIKFHRNKRVSWNWEHKSNGNGIWNLRVLLICARNTTN